MTRTSSPRLYVAFVRNVMVGRRGLTQDVLLDVFARCGADAARSFMATGNVILETRRAPESLAKDASQALKEPVFLRSIAELGRLEASHPFDQSPSIGFHERFVTFFPTGLRVVPPAPLFGPRGGFEIFAIGRREAFGFTRLVGGRPGNPARLLEKLLGAKVTTRNWNTVIRLLKASRKRHPGGRQKKRTVPSTAKNTGIIE